jgi:hypothetical protein
MDFAKFKPSDWMKVGGGLLFFIAYFLKWWGLDIAGNTYGWKGSHYFFTGTVPMLLLLAVGVVAVLRVSGTKLPKLPWPIMLLAATALCTLLIIIRFFFDGLEGGSLDRKVGLFLAIIGAIVALVGSVLGFKESGGDLSDLKDINKIKKEFGMGGDGPAGGSMPPPPPPGS